MAKRPTAWLIAYIDSKKLTILERDLSKHHKYRLIRVYIPTVRVLKKQFKGKDHFDEVPLLFNYGFFEVPEYFLPNPHFLELMRQDIECIYGWVKDPANLIHNINKNPKNIALATTDEISHIIRQQDISSIYSDTEIDNLEIGEVITLHGYPFDGLSAEVKNIDYKKKEVEVKLLLDTHMTQVKVSFANIFYTIYKSEYLNTEMKEKSLDEMKERAKNIDSLFTRLHVDESD